jgi:methyl-accepting chemotaxis protein
VLEMYNFKKLKLSLKFTLILGIFLIVGIIFGGLLLSKTAQQKAEQQVANKAIILMEMMNSVRNYTSNEIQPLLLKQLETETNFIPETIPAYSARQIFDNLRNSPNYRDYFYKEATINPTNLRDKADKFEIAIVEKFRKLPQLTEVSGFRHLEGNNLFYVARPLAITQANCLRCHSSPNLAPKSQIKSYGSEHGFNWKLNEIVGMQTVYVTADEIFLIHQQQLWLTLIIFTSIFTITILLINTLLKQNVIQPLVPMAKLAQRLSSEQISSENSLDKYLEKLDKVAKRSDELGQLATLFRQMANVVSEREQTLQQLVKKLRNETDNAKKSSLVNQIGTTVNIQELIERSQNIREQDKLHNHDES